MVYQSCRERHLNSIRFHYACSEGESANSLLGTGRVSNELWTVLPGGFYLLILKKVSLRDLTLILLPVVPDGR